MAFSYSHKKIFSSLRSHYLVTRRNLSIFYKTDKRLLNEHLSITTAGIVIIAIGVRHLLQEEKVIGGVEAVFGTYLILRSQLPEELQVNKTLLAESTITLLVLDNGLSEAWHNLLFS